ncbi:hypothetical protein DSL72_007633 [Monilinia vaccinii-corymbosi]|uniref:Uncharacterized protein n=1 Tax=Monilinia vaccinii-corymbosi TaxID=61207 RepID=A0A8A3PIB2_9HELO|nr:hypothetical protein DSL72_007633 [Monilinia vaccinii-corymbosi]
MFFLLCPGKHREGSPPNKEKGCEDRYVSVAQSVTSEASGKSLQTLSACPAKHETYDPKISIEFVFTDIPCLSFFTGERIGLGSGRRARDVLAQDAWNIFFGADPKRSYDTKSQGDELFPFVKILDGISTRDLDWPYTGKVHTMLC